MDKKSIVEKIKGLVQMAEEPETTTEEVAEEVTPEVPETTEPETPPTVTLEQHEALLQQHEALLQKVTDLEEVVQTLTDTLTALHDQKKEPETVEAAEQAPKKVAQQKQYTKAEIAAMSTRERVLLHMSS